MSQALIYLLFHACAWSSQPAEDARIEAMFAMKDQLSESLPRREWTRKEKLEWHAASEMINVCTGDAILNNTQTLLQASAELEQITETLRAEIRRREKRRRLWRWMLAHHKK